MRLLYNLGIRLYYLNILLAAVFDVKAKKWITGRRGLYRKLSSGIDPDARYIWFHCASLGEFEQGRPVLEAIRKKKTGSKILLTFFSPSGYEIRKNYPGADYICYLPLDTRKNARTFLNEVSIEQAYFVKYEFWFHFIMELNKRNIPVYLVSARFRKNQIFFRRYGGWFRKLLSCFDQLFVQDDESGNLLAAHRVTHFKVSGDTRFDRVNEIKENAREIPVVKTFSGNGTVLIAGSIWPPDENLLCRYINEPGRNMKWILVPHEIRESHIRKLKQALQKKTLVYSELDDTGNAEADVLIIDAIGLLSSLYRYGKIAYIGGGFGRGIHNTLEAAAFGMPVIFGPRYGKFREAVELITAGAGFPVNDYENLRAVLDRLTGDPAILNASGKSAGDYVMSRLGATSLIVNATSHE